ncbi:MAG TPA: hypothetical protein VGD29_27055 [Actinoplanes sp.]|jgi:hypothetical protein
MQTRFPHLEDHMHKHARQGLFGLVAAAVGAVAFAAPAQAATNPYTPQEACDHQFGGTWSTTTDGHRSLLTGKGTKFGDVYLMYNSATGNNCVATIKSAYVGTASWTAADLLVQGESTAREDSDYYGYYAAVQAHAAGTCVQYSAQIYSPTWQDGAFGGRATWGNCG